MGCGCKKSGPQFAVTMPDGRVVFLTPNEATARSVAARHVGSTVVVQPKV